MTTICITGDSTHALAAVAATLRQAGMAADRPLQRDASVTLAVWHQRVLANMQQALTVDGSAVQPSRLWEQLAVDLLVANLDAPLWGWADAASVSLLDFWAELDDGIRFVLLCRSREQAIAQWLCASEDSRSAAEVLADWHRQQQALLRFHLHHPARSLLVWADEAQSDPQTLVLRLNQQWSLDLALQDVQPKAVEPLDAVRRQLVAHIVHQHAESAELDGELHASVLLLNGEARWPFEDLASADLVADYRRLLDRSAEQAALAAVRTACETETKAREQAQAQLKDAQQEGELLLQQLHTVQEELEKQYLQAQKDQAARQKQVEALTAERNTEAKAKAEALKQRDAEAAAKKAAQALVAELTKARDTEAKAKADALTQLKDAQQEGELLLQQLHTVQEELEQYYLKHQSAQRDLEQFKARWSRLLKSQPDLVDIDTVELAADSGEGQPLTWRLKQASVAGRQFDQLEFSTVVEQGVAGFVWRRPVNGAGALARWPASAKGEQEVTILPVQGGPHAIRRAAHLVQLSTSDNDLMLALPGVISRVLQAGQIEIAPQRQQSLVAALDRYQQIMRNTQALVRFDGVRLLGQQSAPQRDVIALAITELSFGTLRLPAMEFQVQLNKNRDGSTESLHLIFDESTSGAPLKGWFSNVPNTAGKPVMALHLTSQGWAAADWSALPAEDRAFIQALVDSLAIMLVTLQADGVRTERPWAEWIKQVSMLRKWSRVTPQPVVAAPAEPDMLPTPQTDAQAELLATAAPHSMSELETLHQPPATNKPEPKARKPRAIRAKPVVVPDQAEPVMTPIAETAVAPRTRQRRQK